MKPDRRGSWYLLTGAVVGVAMGLVYSWMISPVQYIDAPPYALRADFKDEYRILVAAAYMYNHDLVRAEDRLVQLKEDHPAQNLALQAQRAFEQGHPQAEVRALGILAMELGQGLTPPAASSTQTAPPNNPSTIDDKNFTPAATLSEGQPTSTSQPSSTQGEIANTPGDNVQVTHVVLATPATGASYVLTDSALVCNPEQPKPMIQVIVQDSAGSPLPGIELVVTWEDGQDHFFTGLQPELGLGYADFLMTPKVAYSLTLANGEQVVSMLTAGECQAQDQSPYWGSWLLILMQP
ncbi:MAG: hypothetical protein ACM3H7_00245 [Acidobacteriaceae bacterium]